MKSKYFMQKSQYLETKIQALQSSSYLCKKYSHLQRFLSSESFIVVTVTDDQLAVAFGCCQLEICILHQSTILLQNNNIPERLCTD